MSESSENEIQAHDKSCPLVHPNPGTCIFIKEILGYGSSIEGIERDINWLKKGSIIRSVLDTGTIISVVSLILKLSGVI